ncbi:hypothetical protein NEUTE1DRAFT_53762, partial [Neurospora tetrasperma FGSC 2508]
STSNIASPILLIYKLGNGVRIYVDYKGINNISLKNRYLLLLIKEILNTIYRAK